VDLSFAEDNGQERTVSIAVLTAAVLARLRELTPEGEWVFERD
jgi:hypothetical protein